MRWWIRLHCPCRRTCRSIRRRATRLVWPSRYSRAAWMPSLRPSSATSAWSNVQGTLRFNVEYGSVVLDGLVHDLRKPLDSSKSSISHGQQHYFPSELEDETVLGCKSEAKVDPT